LEQWIGFRRTAIDVDDKERRMRKETPPFLSQLEFGTHRRCPHEQTTPSERL
jgi:hypothetical protein